MQGFCGSVAATWVNCDTDGTGHSPVDASGLRRKTKPETCLIMTNIVANRNSSRTSLVRVERSSHQHKGFKENHQKGLQRFRRICHHLTAAQTQTEEDQDIYWLRLIQRKIIT